jgi:hypothetical protein
MERHSWILSVLDDLEKYCAENCLEQISKRVPEVRRGFHIEARLAGQSIDAVAKTTCDAIPTIDRFELDRILDTGKMH